MGVSKEVSVLLMLKIKRKHPELLNIRQAAQKYVDKESVICPIKKLLIFQIEF